MKIALLGGTGDIGEGLALRFGYHTDHEVVVGSRDADRAAAKAEEYETELDSRGVECSVEGLGNEDAAAADVVVAAVPPYHVADTVESVADVLDESTILVSPATGIKRDDEGFHYHPPKAGSVTKIAADAAPEGVSLVGAYHNLPAGRLANLDADLDIDTFVVGEDADAKDIVTRLSEEIDGLRVLDAGGIANAPEVESVTPLLINVAANNEGLHDLGVQLK